MYASEGHILIYNSPDEGLAGIQVLATLFLGSSRGNYVARLAKRWQDLQNLEVRRTGKINIESKPLSKKSSNASKEPN